MLNKFLLFFTTVILGCQKDHPLPKIPQVNVSQFDYFNKAIDFVFRNEGYYANHPFDRGGKTKYGISQKSYPKINIEIGSHTDARQHRKYNKILSQKRAESIKRFLASFGVNETRLKAIGKGDTEPKSSNDSPEGRLMNRRVEVKLSKTEKVETERTRVEK